MRGDGDARVERPVEPRRGAGVLVVQREVLADEVAGERLVRLLGPLPERERAEPRVDAAARLADEQVDDGAARGRVVDAQRLHLQRARRVLVERRARRARGTPRRPRASRPCARSSSASASSARSRQVRGAFSSAAMARELARGRAPRRRSLMSMRRAVEARVPVVRIAREGRVVERDGAREAVLVAALVGAAVERVDDVRALARPDARALELGRA